MDYSAESIAKRKAAQKLKELRSAQGEYEAEKAFEAAELKAFESGAKKTGGLFGLGIFGGSYSGTSKEQYLKNGNATGDFQSAAGKAGAAKSLLEMATGESVGKSLTGGGESGSMVDGALTGAATGAQFGAPGAAVGAVAGAVMGAANARAKRKAHNAEVEAKKQKALGEIEMEKGKQLSQAIGSMGARMSASLR